MQSLRILVVDDDAVDRMAVRRALLRARFEVDLTIEEASNAERALAMLQAGAWDCVLLDLKLPGTTGLELLADIRRDEQPVAVVMLTGHGDQQSAVEAMKAGAADYLTKDSLEPERLARTVLHAVRVRNAERAEALAREQLEAAEQRYRFLADSIPQMVWVADAHGKLEYVNRLYVEYTGRGLAAVRSDGGLEVVHPDDRDALTRQWSDALATARSFEIQVRIRRASDETYRWHLTRATFLKGVDGTARWFGTSTDIEDQKRAEAELVRLHEVAERERRRVEESNKAKDEFLAVLSHELRTPLNAILGWTGILREPATDARTLERGLCTIERNARVQAQLIEDLLDVSRIIAGKLSIEEARVDLRDVAAAARETVQPHASKKGLTLDVTSPAAPLRVRGDQARLQQVVWNLLTNAVKFTPPGGRISLTIDRDGPSARIVVEDDGVGIDPAFTPHLFERFRQADSSTQRAHGGLGLGLSIVHHLVGLHRGHIEATSEGSGRGARFVVTLPLDEAADVTASPMSAVVVPARQVLHGTEILVVDDDDDGRDMLTAALARQGATVRAVSSVAAAREALERQLPDLLISDIGMPEEDGFSLIEDLRARPVDKGGAVPAVALTGYAGLDDQRRTTAAGFDEHMSKPVDVSKLVNVVVQLLAARSGDDRGTPISAAR